jgi:site-specific DNA-methyltransferase (adenine-specific)
MIYQKLTPMPQFKSHRYTNSFEYMFVFSKGVPTHGTLITEVTKQSGRVDRNYRGQVTADEIYIGKDIKVVKDTKKKTNIWIYSQNNDIDKTINHKAQFPMTLVLDHVKSWSDEGDTVLDPFMGSGTTGVAAKNLNRDFIGIELDEGYFDIAKERINNG